MKRSYEKEMMDLPGQPRELLEQDLRNLRVINRYLGGAANVVRGLRRAVGSHELESFSLLDVATGSADIPLAVLAWAKKNRIGARIVACDADPVTAENAAALCGRVPEITVMRADAFAPPCAPESFDFVLASQFLHHFPEPQIVALLKSWSQVARKAIIVSDLVRHPLAYYGISLLARVCTSNVMTLTDAPLSVKRAFTVAEWRELLHEAGVGPFQLFAGVPFRVMALISPRG